MAKADGGDRIQQIQSAAKIRDVAKALGMAVIKRGSSYLTICPFHADKSPSLNLYDESTSSSHYHCFVCSAHGDSFKLVQQVRGIDFPEAAIWLAALYSLPSPLAGRDLKRDKESIDARLHGLAIALDLFKDNQDSALLERFLEDRKIDPAMARKMELVAIRGKILARVLFDRAERGENWREMQGYLEACGLLRPHPAMGSESRNYSLDVTLGLQDFFYDDRIIFPIRNENDGLIGFAGRRAGEVEAGTSTSPKYLYSPGTAKSEVLYRANEAFENLRDSTRPREVNGLVLVEGLLDAGRVESMGLPSAAILGSQASAKQLTLLKRLYDRRVGLEASVPALVFLDRDRAGIRGSAKLVVELKKIGLKSEYVWPRSIELTQLGVPGSAKDPDDVFGALDSVTVAAIMPRWRHPPMLALLSDELGLSPEVILDPAEWDCISSTRKSRALSEISSSVQDAFDFLDAPFDGYAEENLWFNWVVNFFSASSYSNAAAAATGFVSDEGARLNLARSLACSGVQRGDMAPDLATWRRLDVGATAFNEAIKSRLCQKDLGPLEPFDAMFVSRGARKREHRLKVMPCPEDLIAQQYILNALLTEVHDIPGRSKKFSQQIPAVRHYSESKRTITTGSGASNSSTLSFAYQIDMDVLEGRRPPSGNGMFLPYFDCWKDFIGHLRRAGEQMSVVHVLRLDVRRYYDELGRGLIKDLLRSALDKAAQSLPQGADWIPLVASALEDKARVPQTVVDWICDQSFGYSYFHPETGEKSASPEDRGIPQGPVLSAWLGTIALFPLDDLMRSVLSEINLEGEPPTAAYARYVDDVVLIADSQENLSLMKARAEDAVRRLSLTLIQKSEPVPPMSSKDFAKFLVEGRAFATSEPDAEPIIFDSGDGEAGWQMLGWGGDDFERKISLHLLHDRRLYGVDYRQAINHLYTALRADDLRPKDLAKAARWLWLHSALHIVKEHQESGLWSLYVAGWKKITSGSVWGSVDRACYWEDPAFYALEGLEKLLDLPQSDHPEGENCPHLVDALSLVSREVVKSDFLTNFLGDTSTAGNEDWGFGTRKLRRMFWNHALPLRMKAVKLLDSEVGGRTYAQPLRNEQMLEVRVLSDSLTRALITHFEATGQRPELPARSGGNPNPLRDGVIWLHWAFVAFGSKDARTSSTDPLDGYSPSFKLLSHAQPIYKVVDDKFIPLLILLTPDSQIPEEFNSSDKLIPRLAFAALSAMARWGQLSTLLVRREELVSKAVDALPLPLLPGIVPDDLLMVKTIREGSQTDFETLSGLKVLSNSSYVGKLTTVPVVVANDAGASVNYQEVVWSEDRQHAPLAAGPLLAMCELRSLELGVYMKAPAVSDQGDLLSVAADLFEGLAILNSPPASESEAGREEFVPAWPYLAFENRLAGSSWRDSRKFGLLGFKVRSTLLGNQAFIRAGTRGLQPVAVPAELAHLWRAGVAISDLVGLSDDVDRYQRSLESASVLRSLKSEVLVQSMRRLRGCFTSNSSMRPDPDKPYLPATLSRVLKGMREFPVESDNLAALAFTIALRNETSAMAIRLDQSQDIDGSGGLAYLIERSSRRTVGGIPEFFLAETPSGSYTGPTLRQTTLGWMLLASRIESLPAPTVGHIGTAWNALLAGINLSAIASWLRSLAFEIFSDDRRRTQWSIDLAQDVTTLWGIDEPLLVAVSSHERISLSVRFREAFADSPQRAQPFFDAITPLGWLSIVCDMVGIFAIGQSREFSFSGKNGEDKQLRMEEAVKILAHALAGPARTTAAVQDDESWPFGTSVFSAWGESFASDSFSTLRLIDEYCGYRVSPVAGERWSFDPTARRFTDGARFDVPLEGWQIQALGTGPAWANVVDGKFVSSWTETRDVQGRLLGVAVWRLSFGRVVGGFRAAKGKDQLAFPEVEITYVEPVDSPESGLNGRTAERDVFVAPLDQNIGDLDADVVRRSVGDIQADSLWRRRKDFDGRVRVALLQWQVDDSYRHPIFDTPIEEAVEMAAFGVAASKELEAVRLKFVKQISVLSKDSLSEAFADLSEKDKALFAQACADKIGAGKRWAESEGVFSWVEHRRRRILSSAFDACNKINADILVLPEYSVRPDTIAWIAAECRSKGYGFSIFAGTYRLFGNKDSAGFSETFSEIFGVGDHKKIISTGEADSSASSRGERSSILSLVSPMKSYVKGIPKETVSIFTRRKKYASAAAGEVFNPGLDVWSPLYNLSVAVDELRHRDSKGRRTPSKSSVVSAEEVLQLALRHMPEQYCAELICSEIFLGTSPANIEGMADQYRKLNKRFGRHDTLERALELVVNDVRSLGRALSESRSSEGNGSNMVRRTILVVPAMTSRSADYWIFGQSGLLAAGLTTVFCNASCKKDSVGGSCIVGHNSWRESKSLPGLHPHVTPYSGWSKGIYYNKESDALGAEEQALVIVDVDPVYMNEGKPRPQVLCAPLELIAHLPIIETLEDKSGSVAGNDGRIKSRHPLFDRGVVASAVSNVLKYSTELNSTSLWDPSFSMKEGDSLLKSAKHLSRFTADSQSFLSRLNHWSEYWREFPWASEPPALFDFLWVDHTLGSDESFPTIFTPPW